MSLAPHTPQTPGVPDWMTGDEPTHSGGSFASVEPPHGSTAVLPYSVYDAPAYYATARSTYRPTAEQLARDELRLAWWRRNVRLPLIAVMSLLPLVYVAWWYNRRQKRQMNPETGPMAHRSRVQTLLWQLDSLLDKAQRTANDGGARATRPLIGLHARADYWRAFAHAVRRNFGRGSGLNG